MQASALSIIIPVKNIENQICGILKALQEQTKGIDVEFFVIDIGSKDGTMVTALRFFKSQLLKGYVMQESSGHICEALNAGLQRASGDYISFVYPDCIYQSYLGEFFKSAKTTYADIIFGCKRQENIKFVELRTASHVVKQPTGPEFIENLILQSAVPEVGATMLSKQFLLKHKIKFNENCQYGFGEEFLYRCVLADAQLAQVPVVMLIDEQVSVKKVYDGLSRDIFAPFEQIETLIRIQRLLQKSCGHQDKLLKKFTQRKIPEAIMSVVDGLLKQKLKARAVHSFMRKKEYDKLLIIGTYTPHCLKMKVITWRYFPNFYHCK